MIADHPISKDALFLHDWAQNEEPGTGDHTNRMFKALLELPVEDQVRILFLTMLCGKQLPTLP